MGIRTRLRLARLLLVTDSRQDLSTLVARGCSGGADGVLLEAPSLRRSAALGAVADVRRGGRATQALIGVAGKADVAAEAGADLLLLADDRADARQARRALSPWALVGRSCNAAAEVDAALADPDVDFLLVGPGLDHVRHAARVAPQDDPASKPWFAAGGITRRTLATVLEAGAYRVAVGRAIRDAADPEAAARAFADALRVAWAANPAMDAVTDAAFDDHPVVALPPATGAPGATNLTI